VRLVRLGGSFRADVFGVTDAESLESARLTG